MPRLAGFRTGRTATGRVSVRSSRSLAYTRGVLTVIKSLLKLAIAIAVTVVAFDVVAWYLLPDRYNHLFPGFRATAIGARAGAGDFPRDYYVDHRTRGFDIGPDRQGVHRVEGIRYPIWSNQHGCFDNPFDGSGERIVYLAGDSFSWGFTPFEDKFATLIEAASEARILKCGVTHTGPRHQLEKAREVINRLEKKPQQILLFFVYNDIANDYAHPHSGVIDGWQIDRIRIDEKQSLVAVPEDAIRARMKAMIDAQTLPALTTPGAAKKWLRNYSLSGQVLNQLANRVGLTSVSTSGHVGADQPMQTAGGRITSIYNLDHSAGVGDSKTKFFFQPNQFTEPTREALREWSQFAGELNASLDVVLVPDVANVGNADYYSEVIAFLDELGVNSINLAALLQSAGLADAGMHWRDDPHWSIEGNRRVAAVLCEAGVVPGCDPARLK